MVGSSLNSHNLTPKPIKFLCSYGGRILPRYPDGKLRYHGGETRMGEMCGSSVSLRCQLPTEDLDALVSITSDEDLANLIEEYDRAATSATSSPLKIRAFLSAPKTIKKVSPPPSSAVSCCSDGSPPKSLFYSGPGYHLGTQPRPPTADATAARQSRRLTLLSVPNPPEKSLTSTPTPINATISKEMVAMLISSTTATTGNSRYSSGKSKSATPFGSKIQRKLMLVK
ncbi:UNVERIFIED_CONTAM: hypothetical protein Sradi_4821000 [Sesamum radiatum]|uniref:PB1 domain-containing protein n=1 Tax=Sesamum radiatum TaxID=300843 RepID=A0AAW2MYA0_SESRA